MIPPWLTKQELKVAWMFKMWKDTFLFAPPIAMLRAIVPKTATGVLL